MRQLHLTNGILLPLMYPSLYNTRLRYIDDLLANKHSTLPGW